MPPPPPLRMPVPTFLVSQAKYTNLSAEGRSEKARDAEFQPRLEERQPLVRHPYPTIALVLRREPEVLVRPGTANNAQSIDSADEGHRRFQQVSIVEADGCIEDGAELKAVGRR
jgi:hypothetical protein